MLSADKLILAIQGINMNFDEFGHKLNNYQESLHMQIGRKVVAVSYTHLRQARVDFEA